MNNLIKRLRSKGNNVLAHISMRTGLNLNKPTYICAKMTMRCNSRCVHCNIWKTNYSELELTTEEWYRVLDGLHDWLGSFKMVFTGGEALLRNDLFNILTYAAAKGIQVELLSNGILVDEPLAQRIVDTDIAQFTISFDGITAATHDRFRGSNGFHAKALAAIAALNDYRQGRKSPLNILLKTVISANNIEELAAIAQFSKGQGLDVMYQPIEQNYGECPDLNWYKESKLWIRDTVKLKQEIAQLLRLKSQGYPIVNSGNSLETIIRYFEAPEELMAAVQSHDTQTPAEYCRPAVTNFVISSNGDVEMCWRMSPIGNLRLSSPKEIWDKREHCWGKHCDFR